MFTVGLRPNLSVLKGFCFLSGKHSIDLKDTFTSTRCIPHLQSVIILSQPAKDKNLTNTNYGTLTHTLSLTHTHTYTHSLSLSHTHTRTLSLTHTLAHTHTCMQNLIAGLMCLSSFLALSIDASSAMTIIN